MKRILSIILTVILLVTLISCQKKETTPSITALDPTEATTETETKAKLKQRLRQQPSLQPLLKLQQNRLRQVNLRSNTKKNELRRQLLKFLKMEKG